MKFEVSYLPLPSPGEREPYSRPVVNVQVEDVVEAPLACIVDSGAVYNRFPSEWADAAGISLDDPDLTDTFSAGGATYSGSIVRVRLRIGPLEWEAPVCFVKDWGKDFGLLGHEGFFRWFNVCFHAADERISLEPVEQ